MAYLVLLFLYFFLLHHIIYLHIISMQHTATLALVQLAALGKEACGFF